MEGGGELKGDGVVVVDTIQHRENADRKHFFSSSSSSLLFSEPQ